MTWDRKKPWTAPAKSLVLYWPDGRWRFAIHNEAGIMDGHLSDQGEGVSLEQAQVALLARVEESTGLRYTAAWRSDREGWWSADLTVADQPTR